MSDKKSGIKFEQTFQPLYQVEGQPSAPLVGSAEGGREISPNAVSRSPIGVDIQSRKSTPSAGVALMGTLQAWTGQYKGEGMMDSGESISTGLSIATLNHGRGLMFNWVIRSHDGERILRTEQGWIAPTLDDNLSLWLFGSQSPGVVEHHWQRIESTKIKTAPTLVFRLGEAEDVAYFRQEVILEFKRGFQLSFRLAWGYPGGEFSDRIYARMRRVSALH